MATNAAGRTGPPEALVVFVVRAAADTICIPELGIVKWPGEEELPD
jgi:hypothetical protein